MTRRQQRRITWTMLITFMLSFFLYVSWPVEITEAAVSPTPTTINGYPNKCLYNPARDGRIPPDIAPCSMPSEKNPNGFKFNSGLYYDEVKISDNPKIIAPARKIIVYGKPQDVGKIQSFKKGMQPDGGPTVYENRGYFYEYRSEYGGNVFGEYRYLGFTYDNNLYSNINFIIDTNLGIPLGNKHWIYRPWAELPSSYERKPATPGAVYGNNTSVTDPQFDKVQQYIDNRLGPIFSQSVRYGDRYKVLTGDPTIRDSRNYMSLHQTPTTKERGIGTMYHYSWDSHSIWYQTFFLPQLDETIKDPSKVEAACAVVPVSNKPVQIGKNKKVKIDVKLTGTLQDEAYYNNETDKFLYYTRQDVDYWRLDMRDQATGDYNQLYSNKPGDGVIVRDNTASAVFTIEVDVEKLDRSSDEVWKYRSNAGVFAFFYDSKSWAPSFASKYCNLEVNFEPTEKTPLLSDFGVVPAIQFEDKSQFTRTMVGYEDFSYGEDVDYYEFEIRDLTDGSVEKRKFDPAIPEVKAPKPGYLDQAAVNNYLYNFMAYKFASGRVSETVVRQFEIKQTITDKDSTVNNTSTAIKNVTVVHIPIIGCDTEQQKQQAPPQYITPKTDWPLDWYDVVPFPVTEATPDFVPHRMCEDPASYDQFTKRVFIDGAEIDAEAFYQGEYIFGEDKLGIREVKTTYTAPDGTESYKLQHVVIHESKPRVSIKLEGLYKQNRTMTAIDRSAASNDQWVEQNAPLEITSFSFVNPSDPNFKCRTGYCESNTSEKMFMYKQPGKYQISIAAKRVITYGGGKTITRYSDPYVVDYQILPDHKPALVAHAYNSEISRLDQLQLLYDVVSTDGDYIAEQNMKVYHDSDNDGDFESLVYESDEAVIEKLPNLNKLGQYEIVVEAKEGTNQDRLMEFITAADDKTHTIRSYFFIDNYAPSSDLYLDVPNEKAEMDVYFMLDDNLKQESTDYVRNNKVSLTNAFNSANMIANIGIWDMKTYTYSQSASTTSSTGTSYPSSTIAYSSEGYSGTLTRTDVSNSPYEKDEGKFVSKTDTKTGTSTCSNTVTTTYDGKGNQTGQSSTSECESSKNITDGNYSGTVTRSGETSGDRSCGTPGPSGYTCTRTWTANYSGTLYWTRDVWEPKMVEYDSYTGYYSGTIYKDVRQPYDTSFMRAVPTKYVIYISDGGAAKLSDLQNVMNKHNASLILVGSDTLRSQISHSVFFRNNDRIENLVSKVIQHIAENNPANPKVLKLVGEEILTATATFDAEDDPIPAAGDQLQIIQDPNYYDNSLGFDSFGGKQFISVKSEANWRPYQSIVTLNKPGKYQFLRRVKDLPSTDPNFSGFAYYSNESVIDVYVHRKPIAEVTLDFDYIAASNLYKTTWVDMSYDLDHNITRASTDRGIQARSIKLTSQETGEIYTKIPGTVPPGTYVLDYMAQDIEGVWSDPIQRTFVLPTTVPVQFRSNLKATDSRFSLLSIPASEQLTAYELWTRYPYSISLSLQMPPGGGRINQTVPYYTGTKTGNDINWNNVIMTIPNTTPDGVYNFRIQANGSVAGSSAYKDFSVNVFTPINLQATKPLANDTYVVGYPATISATTTKYPTSTSVILFYGTSYARTVNLTATTTGSGKTWSYSYSAFPSVPTGDYVARFTSTNPSGKSESVNVAFKVTHNTPPEGTFKTYTYDANQPSMPKFEGDRVYIDPVGIKDDQQDTLDANFTVRDPNGVVVLNENRIWSYPYPTSGGPSLIADKVGTYTVTMTLSDRKAAPVVVTGTFTVLPLGITGQVSHTTKWNEKRLEYNTANPTNQRPLDTYWAGEEFVLTSATTNTSASMVRANSVTVQLVGRGVTVNLTNTPVGSVNWSGTMWQDNFDQLPDGTHNFLFTVTYSNSTVKTATVTVRIKDNIWDITKTHQTH